MKKIVMILIALSIFQGFSQDKDELLKDWNKMNESKSGIFIKNTMI